MSNVLNISLNQGEDFLRVLTIKDGANVAIDITGYVFRSQVKEKYTQAEPSFSFDFQVKNQITNTGMVEWSLLNSVLVPISLSAPKSYLYDIEMVDTNSTVTRIIEGKVTVFPEVTK